ncbi:MAG: hypothetical protein QOE90_3533 [Thermoplasmata archaeon]|jgi:hypothetical protein|nr:hypothetical protein [Thermoplasmata archaeon]
MRLALALALLLALVAGCVTPASQLQSASTGAPAAPALAARILDVPATGSEPTIGVTKDGSIYATGGGAQVWKSGDQGKTWANVADPRPRPDLDPYVWVDPRTDRIFSAPDNVVCSNLMWSDDGAKSWTWNPAGGCGLPGHDHQSLVTGPPPKGVSTSGYPDVVYYSYNSFRSTPLPIGQDGTFVDVSLDGGTTWSLGTQVLPADGCEDGLNGAPAAAPDGTVFVPIPRCDGMHVAVSKDAGQTWKVAAITEAGTLGAGEPQGQGLVGTSNPYEPNPGAGVDGAGNAYVAFGGKDGRMYLTRSTDEGATWSKPVVVSAPGVNSTAFSALVAGDAGRVAIAYLGTTADTSGWPGKAAQEAPADAVWHLYVTFLTSATDANPTISSLRVTPADDPVQIGCIWQSGGENACRNLGDFLGMAQRDGRVYVVYADGCDKCASADASHGDDLKVAVVTAGPSLLGGAALAPYG